jgi:magnesium transporter
MAPHVTPALEETRRQVLDLLAARKFETLHDYLTKQHPADIADLLELLGDDERVAIFDLLHMDVAAEVLDETRTEVTRDLVDAIPDEKIADLLETMPMDDAAEILTELHEDRAEDILGLMQPEEAAEVGTLLAYPDDSAGRLMTTDVVRLDAAWTVDETLRHLRGVDQDVETLAYLYVVNGGGKLVGVVAIWDLLTAAAERLVGELMDPDVISVRVDTDQEEVARVVSQYDFLAVPVVDDGGRLLGIITHDDVIDILQEEFTEDVQRFGGSEPLDENYLATSILMVARKRVGWLLVLFLTEMMTGSVMRLFEGELEQVVALAFFVPLLIGTGGNSGSQATSTIIRALAVGEARFEDLGKLLWHEMRVGLLLGLVMAVMGYLRALTWRATTQLALTVSGSLFAIVLWANMIGALLPPLAARLKVDPAVISGPVMSTLVDATGLLIYFSLARAIIGL